MKELEDKKSEEALCAEIVRFLEMPERKRDETRRLQRSGSSRRMNMEADSQDLPSVNSCRSSAVDHVDEISLQSVRKSHDAQVVMSEIAGN